MPSPLLPLAINAGGQLAGNLFKKWFGGKTDFNMINPADYKNQLVMSNAEMGNIRQGVQSRLNPYIAKSQADIKQVGAAGRLPEGATQSALGGIAPKVAQQMGQFETQLQGQQRSSLANYLQMQQQYDAAKMAHEQGNAQGIAAINQQGLGNMSKIALLWSAGLFNDPSQQAIQGGSNRAASILAGGF